ncbi:insulinase family protein [bacterium]|nr:insulinase family protein [bacterium]
MKMTKLIKNAGITMLMLAAVLTAACSSIPSSPSDIVSPPLEFSPPSPEIRTLSNGMRVYLLPNDELPLINGTLVIPAGELADPKAKKGLGRIVGETMRMGGTTNIPRSELDEELEFLAASVESRVSARTIKINMGALSRDTDRVLDIMADVVMHPAFPEEMITLSKESIKDEIRRRADDPMELAAYEFRQRFYGPENPFAWEPTMESLDSITRNDIVKWHRENVGPKDACIGFSGDFDPDELMQKLEKVYGNWDGSNQIEFKYPEPIKSVNPGVAVINKDLTQTTLRMGHQGVTLHHPDELTIKVYNEIFGLGGFSSRLMQEVRSNRGLAYSVGGALFDGKGGGIYIALTQTKNETARLAFDVMVDVMESMREAPVTEEELQRAKDSLRNSFVFQFDNVHEIVNRQMDLDMDDYPADYLETYLDRLDAVTAADVQRVAQELTHPDQMLTVLVGPADELESEFESLGNVTVSEPE